MAYNPTVYVNENPPAINSDNLNKMEQGIYDAQLGNSDLWNGMDNYCVEYITGTNLFDKNNSDYICPNCYFSYNNYKKVSTDSYKAFIAKIDASKQYLSLNSTYAHVVFLSEFENINNVDVNATLQNAISGVVGSGSAMEGVSIPSNAKYVVVSITNAQVSTAQLQYGQSCTAYESYVQMIDGSKMKPQSIPQNAVNLTDLQNEINDNFVPYEPGTNLFDKNNTDYLCEDYYFSYNSYKKLSNTSYVSFIVKIDASEGYLSLNSIYSQLVFLSDYVNIKNLNVNDVLPNAISGVVGTGSALEGQAIPSNAKYVVVSITKVQVSQAQLQYGQSCTTYEAYAKYIDGSKMKPQSIPENAISHENLLTFTVDVNGSGDYTSLRDCINYINTNHLSNVTIKMLEGTYDIKSYFTAEEIAASSFIGLILPKNIEIVGIGKKENIILTYTADESSTAISTLNIVENVNLSNITVKGEKIRYCVHDDYAGKESSHATGNYRNIENVDFIGTNLAYDIPYGAGTKGNSKWIFTNCRFINKTGAMCFSVHDATSQVYEGDYFEFNNCEFIGKGIKSIRLCPATSGYDTTAVFNGCLIQGIFIDSQFTGGENATTVFNILGSGNGDNIELRYYANHDRLSFPKFPEVCKAAINASGSSLSRGDYVKFSSGTIIAGTSGDNNGVLFNDCADGEVGYVNIMG